MCRNLIDTTLLDLNEIKWLNEYHKIVFNNISPCLKDDPMTLEWLRRETCEISRS